MMSRPIRLAVAAAMAMPWVASAQQPPQPGGSAVPGTPDLSVASVRAKSGIRASRIIGAAVTNGAGQQVGTVDDLILDDQGKAMLAVIAVGGFLGVGSKLVAEPYTALKFGKADKVMLPEGSKDSLNAMPSFTYGP